MSHQFLNMDYRILSNTSSSKPCYTSVHMHKNIYYLLQCLLPVCAYPFACISVDLSIFINNYCTPQYLHE